MDHNSGYVWAAYLIVGGTLTTYTVWLCARLRRASTDTHFEAPDLGAGVARAAPRRRREERENRAERSVSDDSD
jgi:hypothetical protein